MNKENNTYPSAEETCIKLSCPNLSAAYIRYKNTANHITVLKKVCTEHYKESLKSSIQYTHHKVIEHGEL